MYLRKPADFKSVFTYSTADIIILSRGKIMRIGIGEILVVLVLFILLFGAKKLPDLAKSLGQAFKAFKKEVKDIKKDMDIDGDL